MKRSPRRGFVAARKKLRLSHTAAAKDFEANIFRRCFRSSETFVATYFNGETPGGQTITS
jgi:hypothetical protein